MVEGSSEVGVVKDEGVDSVLRVLVSEGKRSGGELNRKPLKLH